jgi:lipopolysaccharide transport system permease protein
VTASPGVGVNSARYLVTHFGLLWRVTRNEVATRYAGSLLGFAWFLLAPLLMLGVYGAVYLFIFRVSATGLSRGAYVLYIFAGLVPFLATSEALSLGVPSVVANRSVLSNTVFPIDLVPAKAVLGSQGVMVVGLAIVLVGAALTGRLAWTVLLLPVVWLLHVGAVLGVLWVLTLVNVVFRDLQSVLNVFLMLMLIASPIAYTPAMVPEKLRLLLRLNPFSYLVTAYQSILVLGSLPTAGNCLVLVLGSLTMFLFGSWFFGRAKRVMIDYV